MNQPNGPHSVEATTRESGVASGRDPGIQQPVDVHGLDDRARNADESLRGVAVEDQLRDKRSKGVAGAYDDSIDHEADQRYSGPNAAERPAKPMD